MSALRWLSTRGQNRETPGAITLSDCLVEGLAPDGGLYVPEKFPDLAPERIARALKKGTKAESLPEVAAWALEGFFAGDRLERELPSICEEALSIPLVLKPLKDSTSVLELFHGPSAAFKDFGARFLATCLDRLGVGDTTILVATSGDTGGAVAAAFHARPGRRVVILFPKGRISARQQKQLGCWGESVRAFAVEGSFDDCQRLVKGALGDSKLRSRMRLGSANSVNVGRLLPQLAYFAAASLEYARATGKIPALAVPSGNLGNSLGALWAKHLGFPIRHVGMAVNANRPVPEFLESGKWQPRPALATLANAMDVGNPSNAERLLSLYPGGAQAIRADVSSVSVDDETIRARIAEGEKRWGQVWCPHTATAVHLREQAGTSDWIIAATAHPAKFETIVEPLVGHPVQIPASLREILSRPSRFEEIGTDYEGFRAALVATA